MSRNTRNFPKRDSEELQEQIQKLKSRLRKVQKENRMLKEELTTLRSAWEKTEAFLRDVTEGVPLEELLEVKTLPKKAVRSSTKNKEEDPRSKWKKWLAENKKN
jgi:predicted nuclease with TOPRIM domain